MSEFSDEQKEYLDELFFKLSTSINKKFTEVANQISEIKNEINEVTKSYEEEIEKLTDKNKQLEKEVKFLQKKVRKNNIVIYGIKVDHENDNLCEAVVNILNQHLEINLDERDINDIYRLGKNKNKQPILVELVTYRKKRIILRNVKKLRGKNIFIAEDRSEEDREKTKILVKYLNEYRAKGKRAQIRGNRLITGNKAYSPEELQTKDIDAEEEEEENEGNNSHASVSGRNIPVGGNASLLKEQPQRIKPDEAKPSKIKTDFNFKKNLRSTTAFSKK